MDRDAVGALPIPSDPTKLAEVVPPFEWDFVRKIGFVGVGLLAVAAIIGLVATIGDMPKEWPGHYPRLFLVLLGSITVGAAVSMRPDLWQAWALGTVGAVLGIIGLPAHWDSFRMLFTAMAGVGLAWTVFLVVPRQYRIAALSAVLLFHFSGIFLATTTPPSTPWVTEQAYVRVYNPYLQFIYMRNAYHFYSPQPGPASVLVFLLKTETGTNPITGKKQYETKWVVLPRRPADVKDPLGLTYYRYLAVTEQVARATPALRSQTFEANEMRKRRQLAFLQIPQHPTDELDYQYQLLQPEVARYVVPSYASHVIIDNTPDAKTAAKTTVKMYRVQHNTMGIEEFINWRKRDNIISSPYHPTTYRPYFLGEFDALGNLVDPQAPMLYWLVPIVPRPIITADPSKRNFIDFMSIHALARPEINMETVDNPEFKGDVFDWNQLR
jgi:hypothetical protein